MTSAIKLPKALRPEGIITLDIFSIDIPVWTDETIRLKALAHLGIEVEDPKHQGIAGCVGVNQDRHGCTVITMMITPEAGLDTWAHEAVHLADLLMESRGIPTDVSNTEVRAYITGYATQEIADIIEGYHDRMEHKAQKAFMKAERKLADKENQQKDLLH